MDETTDTLAGLGAIAEITEKTARFLDSIGIEFSVLGLQIIALCAILAVLIPLVLAAWRKEGVARYVAFAGVIPLALLVILMAVHWIVLVRDPVPTFVAGRVEAADLHGLRIGLLDFRGREIPAGPSEVDSVTGRFSLDYRAAFGDYPRQFVLIRSGCQREEIPISLAKLQARQRFELTFRCGAGP